MPSGVPAMNATRATSLGLGAIVTAALASCPIVQAAVLGMVGALSLLPFLQHHRFVPVLAVLGCAVLAVYGVNRVRRRQRESAAVSLPGSV